MRDNDIVIHPRKSRKDPEIPEKGILLVTPGEFSTAMKKVLEHGGSREYLHNSNLAVTADKSRFIAGPAVGAPVAALVLEKLIILGARNIVLMGWCGAVDAHYMIGDVLVPHAALSGEGTSRYYSTDTDIVPSAVMVDTLSHMCDNRRISWKSGKIWSTDAPYRESKKYMAHLNTKEKVVGVDMEFSALCSVASFREVDFGAILVVSDQIWGEKWVPGFKNTVFKERISQVVDMLLDDEWESFL